MGIKLATFKILSDFIKTTLNVRPYLEDSNFIRPNGFYICCKFFDSEPQGYGGIRQQVKNETGRSEVVTQCKINYIITACRDGAMDAMFDLGHAFFEPDTRRRYLEQGMGLNNVEGPFDGTINLNEILMEERAFLNTFFFVNYQRNDVRGEEPGIIERVTMDGDLYTSGGDLIEIQPDTINVT